MARLKVHGTSINIRVVPILFYTAQNKKAISVNCPDGSIGRQIFMIQFDSDEEAAQFVADAVNVFGQEDKVLSEEMKEWYLHHTGRG